jgi:hypothetical protein
VFCLKPLKVFAAQNGLTLSSVAEKAFQKLLQESEKIILNDFGVTTKMKMPFIVQIDGLQHKCKTHY